MNLSKKRNTVVFSIVLLLSSFGNAMDYTDFSNDMNDGPAFDIFDDPDVGSFLDNTEFSITRQIEPDSCQDILVSVGAQNLLQNELYLETYRLNFKDIIYNPAFIEDVGYCFGNYVVGFNFFYDQTSAAHFSAHSTSINRYLAISNDDLLQALDDARQKIKDVFGIDFDIAPSDVFPLFENTKIQERRVGFMAHLSRQYKKCKFLWMTPFYYRERNYYLTEKEQDRIEAKLGATTPEEQKKFQKDHLISDKLGFGDTRLAVQFPILEGGCYKMNLGLQVLVPTAFAVVKGIAGSTYTNYEQPTIDLCQLINLGSEPDTRDQASAIGQAFSLGALDRLSSMLLETGLGQDKHFGLGAYLTTKTPLDTFINRPWAETIILKGKIMLEYLFPATNKRFFIQNPSTIVKEFAARNFHDPNQAVENLAFLDKQFVDRFYPYAFNALVYPGIVLMWTSKFTRETERWNVHIGQDTYIKSLEKIKKIDTSDAFKKTLALPQARGIFSYQWTLFGSVGYKIKRPNHDWIISLYLGDTLSTSGIGHEFTMTFNIEKNF